NCSVCWKCRMTLAALDLIGAVDRFASQFDLEQWRADRDSYLAVARHTSKPALVAELGELMDEVGYQLPLVHSVRGRANASRAELDRWQGHARWRLRKMVQRN